MTTVTCHMPMSVDRFVAGVNQRLEEPFGDGPRGRLHRWMVEQPEVNAAAIERITAAGAYVMGRNMFGPGRGAWDLDWTGWWGEDPPYHAPVFVLTHYPHDPVEMEGGTTFHFVTSFDEAMERALEAAGDDTVTIAGGASAVRQGLEAGVIDEIMLNHAPIVLGGGESPFAGLDNLRLKPIEVHASPNATHIVYSTRDVGDTP